MPRVYLVLAFVQSICCFAPTLQAQLYELPFEEIINRSTLVLEGRVINQESRWDVPHHNIFSNNTIQVTRVFKGPPDLPATLHVITQGGIVGNEMHLVSESAQYAPGDAGLFCLIPAKADLALTAAWENYGSPQGFFQYDLSGNYVGHPFHSSGGIAAFRERVRRLTGDREILLPGEQLEVNIGNRATPVISSFTPTSISAGTNSTLTINGSNFGATQGTGTVRFFNSNANNTRFDVDASDIVSWSDNQIEVLVPSTTTVSSTTAGTGTIQVRNDNNETGTSSGTLTVEFANTNFINSGTKYSARLVDMNGNGGLTFTISTTICSNQDATNAFGRALREWRCASGVNWVISTSTTTVNSSVNDNINIVTFDVGTSLPSGVLGRTTSRFIGCSNGGDVHWYVEEVDVNMNDDYSWYYCDAPTPANMPSGSFDFQSVAFHELGHGHQLGHVIDASAVMHYAIASKSIKRVLNANEEAGADYALNLSANPCGPLPMTLISPAACANMTMPTDCDDAGPCTLSLPVELTAFSGKAEPTGIALHWSTASEFNNAYFTLERSADAVQFSTLAQVPGETFSTQLKDYRYFDNNPMPGLNYYRLRQTDLDGSQSLLGMIAVAFGEAEPPAVRVFPNPAGSESVFVQVDKIENGQELELLLTDLSGQLVRRQLAEAGSGALPFHMEGLRPGSYLLYVYDPASRRLLGQVLVIRQ